MDSRQNRETHDSILPLLIMTSFIYDDREGLLPAVAIKLYLFQIYLKRLFSFL